MSIRRRSRRPHGLPARLFRLYGLRNPALAGRRHRTRAPLPEPGTVWPPLRPVRRGPGRPGRGRHARHPGVTHGRPPQIAGSSRSAWSGRRTSTSWRAGRTGTWKAPRALPEKTEADAKSDRAPTMTSGRPGPAGSVDRSSGPAPQRCLGDRLRPACRPGRGVADEPSDRVGMGSGPDQEVRRPPSADGDGSPGPLRPARAAYARPRRDPSPCVAQPKKIRRSQCHGTVPVVRQLHEGM